MGTPPTCNRFRSCLRLFRYCNREKVLMISKNDFQLKFPKETVQKLRDIWIEKEYKKKYEIFKILEQL